MALTESVRAAIAAMPWLTPADGAAVDLAVSYAQQIEAGLERGGQDATKAMYLGPHLLAALTALGATPKGRREVGTPATERAASTLQRLRADHLEMRSKQGRGGRQLPGSAS